jgi:hypothetical protein
MVRFSETTVTGIFHNAVGVSGHAGHSEPGTIVSMYPAVRLESGPVGDEHATRSAAPGSSISRRFGMLGYLGGGVVRSKNAATVHSAVRMIRAD